MSQKLVAYFSATGTTARVARRLAKAAGADLFEIVPKVPYTQADLDWRNPDSRSSVEMKNPASRPEISGRCEALADCETLYLGFPIWWYVAPTLINTFLEAHDLSGKTVIPFATSGGSDIGHTVEKLLPSCGTARLRDGRVFPADVSAEALAQWAASF